MSRVSAPKKALRFDGAALGGNLLRAVLDLFTGLLDVFTGAFHRITTGIQQCEQRCDQKN